MWLAVDGFVVGCFPGEFSDARPGTTLAIYLTDEARVFITVVNGRGEKIRDFIEGIRRLPGEYLVVWDGLDNDNRLVPPGEYLFEIIMRRHQTRSTIMTSNRPLEEWGKLIGDVPAASAILDRFLHHAHLIKITGKSYRMKERLSKEN